MKRRPIRKKPDRAQKSVANSDFFRTFVNFRLTRSPSFASAAPLYPGTLAASWMEGGSGI